MRKNSLKTIMTVECPIRALRKLKGEKGDPVAVSSSAFVNANLEIGYQTEMTPTAFMGREIVVDTTPANMLDILKAIPITLFDSTTGGYLHRGITGIHLAWDRIHAHPCGGIRTK